MKIKHFAAKDFSYIIPASLLSGAWLAAIQDGGWFIGWASFSFLFLLTFTLLRISFRWANAGRTLGVIIALAFFLRLGVGMALQFALPVYGYDDADDQAGFVSTDAHRRDGQAWEFAGSGRFILEAFSDKFAYDQYGGLLAFSALVYRYLSPDAHRPLMLVLLSALAAALGVPFLWRAAKHLFGEKAAFASAWIFALYPESILLGSSAMREPYLLMFSALSLWGFVEWQTRAERSRSAWLWLGAGLLGMLLVSPAIALATLIILAGWTFFAGERGNLSWKTILTAAIVFMAGLFFLSAALNRSGQFDSASPLHIINDWLRLAVKWDAYQLEAGSGWVQKIFDEGPAWIRLPFITIYGIFQPVLPAALVVPTKTIWKAIYILRALGWYVILPALVVSFVAGSASGHIAAVGDAREQEERRKLLTWLALVVWVWVLLAALRAGGDSWDNPRYRAMLFVWQALLAGYVWVWWRETRNIWFTRVVACEIAFLVVFTQWYASRYFHWGGQLPFAALVALILGLWTMILGIGWRRDKKGA